MWYNRLLLYAISALFTSLSYAQTVSSPKVVYEKIILPEISDTTNIRERIVFLAWQNNPAIRRSMLRKEISDANVRIARSGWLAAFRIIGNLNEFNIGPTFGRDTDLPQNFFFPRYNFGVAIGLDYFSRNKNEVKIAKAEREISREDHNLLKLQIRADALSKYQIYYTARELFRFQQEITEDAYVKYLSIEQQFKNGERSLEDYENALRGYKNEQIRRLTSEREFFLAKYDLEKLIGVPIEQVK
ncbi:TolC family protein [Rhodoflexus sp.]